MGFLLKNLLFEIVHFFFLSKTNFNHFFLGSPRHGKISQSLCEQSYKNVLAPEKKYFIKATHKWSNNIMPVGTKLQR
jgi:hypothetical protein